MPQKNFRSVAEAKSKEHTGWMSCCNPLWWLCRHDSITRWRTQECYFDRCAQPSGDKGGPSDRKQQYGNEFTTCAGLTCMGWKHVNCSIPAETHLTLFLADFQRPKGACNLMKQLKHHDFVLGDRHGKTLGVVSIGPILDLPPCNGGSENRVYPKLWSFWSDNPRGWDGYAIFRQTQAQSCVYTICMTSLDKSTFRQ